MTLDYLQNMVHTGHHHGGHGHNHQAAVSTHPTINVDHHPDHHQQRSLPNQQAERPPETRPDLNADSHPRSWNKWQQYMYWRMHGHRSGLPRPAHRQPHIYHNMPGHYRRHLHHNVNDKKEVDELDLFHGQSAFLGPQLWDKTLPYDGKDFELEYMDLDEFLQENGISDDLSNIPSPPDQGHNQGSPTGTALPALSPQHSPRSQGESHSTTASPMAQLQDISASSPPKAVLPPIVRSPSHCQDSSDSKGSIIVTPALSPSSVHPCSLTQPSPTKKDVIKREVEFLPQELALATIPASSMSSVDMRPSLQRMLTNSHDNPETGPTDDNKIPHSEYCPSSGEEDFDPRRRAFSEEELRPQPMIKKSRKVFVPEDLKDDKYWARRRKNNVAAKRSRDARRTKENQIAMRASFLERQFDALGEELELVRKENLELRKKLAKYEPGYSQDSS